MLELGFLAVVAFLIGVPCIMARGVALIPVPFLVRVTLLASVPALLLWWLAVDPEFRDITNLGAALIPLLAILGWLIGATWTGLVKLMRFTTSDTRGDQVVRDQRERLERMR